MQSNCVPQKCGIFTEFATGQVGGLKKRWGLRTTVYKAGHDSGGEGLMLRIICVIFAMNDLYG